MMKPQRAAAILYTFDVEGTFTMCLVNGAGTVFATATVEPEEAEQLADFIDDHFGGDTIGEVAGHA